jgi:tetratricopeptide (TPR) repeat protein
MDTSVGDKAVQPATGQPLGADQRLELQALRREAESTLKRSPEELETQDRLRKQRLQDRETVRELMQKRQWAEAIRLLDGLVETDGAYRPDRVARGDAHFKLGHWDKAAADYAHALELRTTADDLEGIAFRLASLRVNLGDADGYRRTCSALLEKLKQTENPRTAYLLARICVLGPGALLEYSPAVRLAKQAVAADARAPWYLHALGAAYFRAGQFDQAIQPLRESMAADPNWPAHACNWLVLAQVYQALGQEDEARRWLDKAKVWLDTADPKAAGKSLNPLSGVHPHDALACQLLRREAVPLLLRPTNSKKGPR